MIGHDVGVEMKLRDLVRKNCDGGRGVQTRKRVALWRFDSRWKRNADDVTFEVEDRPDAAICLRASH